MFNDLLYQFFRISHIKVFIQDLESEQPDAEILPGYGVRTARVEKAPAEIERFLKENGYIEGEVDPLPDYSEQMPVTEEDVKIFDAACGNYQFPLGTPVTVGLRKTPSGTDFLFNVKSNGPDGSENTSRKVQYLKSLKWSGNNQQNPGSRTYSNSNMPPGFTSGDMLHLGGCRKSFLLP